MSNKSIITLGEPTTEKEYVSQPENGVGFEFGKSVIDLKTQPNLIRYFDKIKHEIVGTQNKVIIRGYASHPGKNSFNRSLSLKRAKSLRTWLIDQGVDSERISVIPMGEWATETGIDEPENPEAEYDVAESRTAIIDIEYSSVPEPTPEKKEEVKDESELAELRNERFPDNFDQDWSDGKEIFQKLVEPEADLIRREIALPENPIKASPSDNQEIVLEQIWRVVKDARKVNSRGIAKVLGSAVLGGFFDLAVSNLAGDVADQRYDMYQALSIAVAAGIDENYVPDLKNMTDVQSALYDHLLPKVEKLSIREKHAIQVYLIEKNQGSVFSVNPTGHSEGRLDDFFSGATIKSGAETVFNTSDYRFKSSHDDSNLYFVEGNGILIIQSWDDVVNEINEMIETADKMTDQSDNDVISQPSDSVPIQNPWGSDEDSFDSVELEITDLVDRRSPADKDIILQPFDPMNPQLVDGHFYTGDPDEPHIEFLGIAPYPADNDIVTQPSDLNSSSDHVDAEVTTGESDMDYPDPDEPNDLFDEHDKDGDDNKDDYDKDIGEVKEDGEVKEAGEDEDICKDKDIGEIKENGEARVSDENDSVYGCEEDEPPSSAPSSDAANAEASDGPDAPA